MRSYSSKTERRAPPALALFWIVIAGFLFQGCGDITSSGRPGNARFLLDGPESASMDLMTSKDFFIRQDGGIEFQSTDTMSVNVPFEDTVPLGAPARFYISAANGGEEAQIFTMKVWIGGKSWYNETKILEPGDDFEFVYRYNEPGIY